MVTPNLVIFDLCDTLYDVNTTVGFIQQYQSRRRLKGIERTLRRWTSKSSPSFYLGAITHRLFGMDIARRRIIAALAGEPKASLVEAAQDYARNILPSHENRPLHDRLKNHLAAGDRVMLLSNSIDLVVAEIALMLGVEWRASKLGFDGERCTGKLERDFTGRKSSAIRDLIESARKIYVYTDNQSDRDLIAIADFATIVIPHGRTDVAWGGSRCDYVRL